MKTKKKKVTKKSTKAVATKKKKKVMAIAEPAVFFRVEIESPVQNAAKGTVEYTYITATGRSCVDEKIAAAAMAELKEMGVGGRLIKLDGSPDGVVTERWGSVGRVAEAEKTERAALEQQQK